MIEKQQNNESNFLSKAESVLIKMDLKSKEMSITGVGIIAYYDSETASWVSKMKVMGALKNDTVNFLSVAYSKAGEMIDTLKNSGTTQRTPLLG